MNVIHTQGSRKNAVARATLYAGNGIVRVNSALIQHFQPLMQRQRMQEPLLLAGSVGAKFDINVNVRGGGPAAQADAVRLSIARALIAVDKSLQPQFLDYDRTLLVADVRRKETHKPNCHGKSRSKRQKSYR